MQDVLKINAGISISDTKIEAKFGDVIKVGDYEEYEGATEVIPKTENQSLETANKLMRSDILVREIPYVETSNLSGGYTVNIG